MSTNEALIGIMIDFLKVSSKFSFSQEKKNTIKKQRNKTKFFNFCNVFYQINNSNFCFHSEEIVKQYLFIFQS